MSRRHWWLGLVISLFFAFVYGSLAMQKGFAAAYVVQDDARHYLFWMERFRDAGAFPNDAIADYLQSIAPVGYKLLYCLASYCSLQPDWVAKVLPALLGLITAGYYYGLGMTIFPVPVAGVMASVMFSQHLWCNDDLVSASPRSFVYPLLIPLLFYFVRRQRGRSLVFLALLMVFYPPVAVVATTLYATDAVDWPTLREKWHRPWVTVSRGRLKVAIAALLLAGICIIPTYLLAHESFGPVVTMAQARTMPEFQPAGRHSFFRDGIDRYWLVLFGGHGAILKRTLFTPVTLVGALFLWPMRRTQIFPGLRTIQPTIHVLTKLTLVSLVWFAAAYAQAFKLHMPGRYTSHCIMVAVPILAAIAWTVILETLCKRLGRVGAPGVVALILVPLLFYYPLLLKKFPKTLYVTGHEAPIYEYLQQQPPNTLVASLDYEADNIPVFAKRSVLIAPEYATPFHLGYYQQMRQRGEDLLAAHYTRDRTVLKTFVDSYGVDFWLVHKAAFSPEYLAHHRYWANNYQPLAQSVAEQMTPDSVLQMHTPQCTVAETEHFWLASSRCLLDEPVASSQMSEQISNASE